MAAPEKSVANEALDLLRQAERETQAELTGIRNAIQSLAPADKEAPARRKKERENGTDPTSVTGRVEEVMAAHGQMKRADLASSIKAPVSSVDQALSRLVKAGKVKRLRRGTYRWRS